jgi:hypothetical protein
MTTETEIMPEATLQPFEFALLALDFIDDQELALNDQIELDAQVLQGGFSLQYTLGTDMVFNLDHDEDVACYVVSVGATTSADNPQQWQRALSMNNLMPHERRFAIDAHTQSLILKESWSTEGLDLVNFAAGVRTLINVMQVFLSADVQPVAQSQAPDASYLRV